MKVKSESIPTDVKQDLIAMHPDQDRSELAGDIPVHGQIISMSDPRRFHIPMVLITTILLILTPFAALTWASYQNWPAYLYVPPIISHTTDALIAKTPLPLTPAQIFRIVITKVAQFPAMNHQLLINSTQTISGNYLSLTISGKSTQEQQAEWLIAGRYQVDNQTIPLNAQIIRQDNELFFKVTQTTPLPNADFSSINSQWVRIPIGTGTENSIRITPGQQALSKIRNTKLAEIFSEFFTTLQETSILVTDQETAPPSHYLIKTTITGPQITELLKQIIAVYQETQTFHNFEPTQMEQWYDQIEQYLADPIQISTLINKNNLIPEIVSIATQLDPEYVTSSTSDAPLATFDKQKRAFATEINYTPTFTDELFQVETSPDYQEYQYVNWRELIRYPILTPLMDYLASSSVHNL